MAYLICRDSSSWHGVLCSVSFDRLDDVLIAKCKALSLVPSCQVAFAASMLLSLLLRFLCMMM